MSLWTTFGLPRRHRDTRRTPAKLTVRLTVEELEPRNAPGSLLSVGGQTALSLAGSGSSAPIAATRANAAVASTPSVVASQTSSAPTTTQTTVPATPTTSGGTSGLVPSLAGNASTTPDADPFVDDASSPLAAAAPVAAPASANAAAASPAVNDFASSLPTIGGSPTATPAAVAAMPTQSGPDADLSYLPPPTVTLTAPAFVNYRGSPLLAVQATAGGANNTLNPTVEIDIDLQHDGSFTDPGDQNFASGTIGANGTAAITLTTPLSAGTYTLRARVADAEGNVGVSANATMQVDPNSGFVGSEAAARSRIRFALWNACPDGRVAKRWWRKWYRYTNAWYAEAAGFQLPGFRQAKPRPCRCAFHADRQPLQPAVGTDQSARDSQRL